MRKQRRFWFVSFFISTLLLFIIQKPLFMLYNGASSHGFTLIDVLNTIWHGASLDLATTAYLSIVPWLIAGISLFAARWPWRNILMPYFIVLALLLALIFIADTALYTFWGFKLDSSIFLYLDSPKNAMASVSTAYIATALLFVLLWAGGIILLWRHLTPTNFASVRHPARSLCGWVLTGGVLFLLIRGGITQSTTNIGQAYFSNRAFLNHSAVNPAFSLFASLGKNEKFDRQFRFFDESERAAIYDGLYHISTPGHTPALLKTSHPNILLILMESFGGTMIEAMGGTPEAAPNLSRLAGEGVFFSQCYANSFRTDRGTICALSGHLGLPTVSIMKLPNKSRTLPSIAATLRRAGYRTDFLHGGDINFTNMKSYLLTSGYEHITWMKDFSLKAQRSNAWGVNDEYTFDHLFQQIMQRTDSPWFTTFLTLSSHEPFEVPYHRLKEKIPNAFAYTDHCIGTFIERLKGTAAWDNLLIILVPDHGIYYPREGATSQPRFFHIPLIWTGGAVKNAYRFDEICNQADLAATLLTQLGLPHGDFRFSRNVLSDRYTYPCAFYSYNNGFAFRDSTGVTVVDNATGKPNYEHPAPNPERIRKGQAILQTAYDDLESR